MQAAILESLKKDSTVLLRLSIQLERAPDAESAKEVLEEIIAIVRKHQAVVNVDLCPPLL